MEYILSIIAILLGVIAARSSKFDLIKILRSPITINYKLFNKGLPMLSKDKGNAGFDLYVRSDKDIVIKPNQVAMVPLNIATEIPEGLVGLLFQRSSTFNNFGVRLTNNVGVIDSTYRGDNDEWKAQFMNVTENPITLQEGDKICQAVFLELANTKPNLVENLSNKDRGGFGTTGRR